MIHSYNLLPTVWHARPWSFDWDDEVGTVSGPDAEAVLAEAALGDTLTHPCPAGVHRFGPEPLKSKTDMAAIIGWEHHLPDDLAEHYPQMLDDGIPEKSYVDSDGVYVIGRDHPGFCY